MSSDQNSVQGPHARRGDVSVVKGALRGARELKFEMGTMP